MLSYIILSYRIVCYAIVSGPGVPRAFGEVIPRSRGRRPRAGGVRTVHYIYIYIFYVYIYIYRERERERDT